MPHRELLQDPRLFQKSRLALTQTMFPALPEKKHPVPYFWMEYGNFTTVMI